jgi:CDGSH-type Zn-finger protein
MSEVRITVLKDGPIEVSGPVELVDAQGGAHAPDESPIYLCRCGQSSTKPFCDGSHRKCGFKAAAWTRTA